MTGKHGVVGCDRLGWTVMDLAVDGVPIGQTTKEVR